MLLVIAVRELLLLIRRTCGVEEFYLCSTTRDYYSHMCLYQTGCSSTTTYLVEKGHINRVANSD
jgi:hypothetical protein